MNTISVTRQVTSVLKFIITGYEHSGNSFDVYRPACTLVRFTQVKETGMYNMMLKPHVMTYYLPSESFASVRRHMEAQTVFRVEITTPIDDSDFLPMALTGGE
jgi:hypothetical protein